MRPDGSGLRQLTDGPFDDFSPRLLPNGKIIFISTRRLGWHRCGNPGCENYTLAMAEADGSNPRSISPHETHEWDPAVLNDGRVVYTRWDYVDRHAVFYEHLWTVRPDGSAPTALYGNNTYNPVGLWEARAVPGSTRVMATAAAHHGMTAGSIVLVDVGRGVDGPAPLTRLTPDAPFPESECVLLPRWRAWAAPGKPPPLPEAARRWPGHCYRSPHPLSEHHFLAAYSFDSLIGEPKACPANMFGLYLVDRFGNKELLYRDLNIASLWPAPLARRRRRPVLAAVASAERARPDPANPGRKMGTFVLQDVYQSDPKIPPGTIRRLRVIQVLPKSTAGINNPMVGLANASPGKQVLGTVPVAADGSACFRAPAGLPLAFQALDERGQAVQIMRSITYVQPGEVAACVGCHEDRTTAPPPGRVPLALRRAPATIRPGPAGSKPLSYPRLVQPVLDRHCLKCHSGPKPKGKRVLTGEPQGRYTRSYNVLAPRVPVSAWGRGGGNWQRVNSEPISQIDHFGARGSALMKMLLKGHNKVKLSADDIERLATWMDANALFYGTFDPADQARQQRGELIAGPGLE
jgi:cytochrome c553